MFNLKAIGLVVAVVVVVGGGSMLRQKHDLTTNYTLVEARITSVDVDCFIKDGREKVITKSTEDLAYMDCRIAPIVAARHGFKDRAIKKRASISYRYRSPVDARVYTGTYVREREVDGYTVGKKIRVHAHKTEPGNSRTTKANLFVADTGV